MTGRADQYDPLPDEPAARWAKYGRSDTVYYPMLLGLEVEEVRIDYCRMRLPFKPELLQPGGVVHGGAIASLMDAVLVPAVGSVLSRDDRYSTVDLHVQYIGAVRDEDVVAEGWVTKRGRSVVFCESEALGAASGRLIARSVLTYNVSTTTPT
ncbi:MAG TPA: PaaI family thioesterase [Ilumatobacteraceae bacterium]|nr:PaaI family thioesterase [Ilumatobacteraceae bacterium]